MSASANIIAYNIYNLQNWREEFAINQNQISLHSAQIVQLKQLLNPLEIELRQANSQISSVESQLAILRVDATFDMAYHHGYNNHHHHHHGADLAHAFADGVRAANIMNLQTELRRLRSERAGIMGRMQPHQSAKNRAIKAKNELALRQHWLNVHITAAESFINEMHYNPAQLAVNLHTRFIAALNEYEATNFEKLSPAVRMSLFNFKYGLNALIVPFADVEIQRQNYLTLCGFLWEMYSQAKQENKDEAFLDCIVPLIESTHIIPVGVDADNLGTMFHAVAWYEATKNANPTYFVFSEQELLNKEAVIFEQAMHELLDQNLVHQNEVQRKIAHAAELIHLEVSEKSRKQEPIDFYFYTRIAHNLINAYNNPADSQATKRLLDMAEYASGTGSLGKKVLGGLLVALGALLIVASIASFFATMGSSSLLSAGGVALGLTFIGLTFATSAAAGVGLTFWGAQTIKSGMRQGLSKELVDIQIEADKFLGATL